MKPGVVAILDVIYDLLLYYRVGKIKKILLIKKKRLDNNTTQIQQQH